MTLRHRALRALPARAAVRLQGRARAAPRPSSSRSCGWRSCDAPADARRLEVRLLRRLPALAARLRGRAAARSPASSTSPTSRRRARARLRGALRPLDRRGLDHHARRRRAHPRRSARARGGSSRSAPARPPAASRRCATSPTSTDFVVARLRRAPQYISHAARLDAGRAPTSPVDFELQGCPPDKRQLLEVISAFLQRPPARRSPRTASASSASAAATSASWSPTARRAWAR